MSTRLSLPRAVLENFDRPIGGPNNNSRTLGVIGSYTSNNMYTEDDNMEIEDLYIGVHLLLLFIQVFPHISSIISTAFMSPLLTYKKERSMPISCQKI